VCDFGKWWKLIRNTGLFDNIIKAVTGAMPGGKAVQAGMAGGLAAGGVVALTDVLKDVFSHSKILTTVLGTISQALGLLIDVILLPFLPILITGIIWLYQGIMLFYKLWSSIWSSKVVQDLATSTSDLAKTMAKGISGFLQIGFVETSGSIIMSVLEWLMKLVSSNGIIGLSFALIFGLPGAILNWIYDVATGKNTGTIALIVTVAGAALSFLQWLWNTITSGGANLVINLTSGASSAVSNAVSTAGSWLSGAESMISNLLHFDNGGVVPGSGAQLAVVHGGETVSKAGQSTGNITINANNYVGSKTELMKVVTDALRQNQYRYNV